MDDLRTYFDSNKRRQMLKWHHYFEIYDRHFHRFRNTDVTILEIGVAHGGSLQMWREYFGPNARVIGVDCDARCKALEDDRIHIEIGNQTDRGFLRRVKQQYP